MVKQHWHWPLFRTFIKFIYEMMRGEYYAPPPAPPKPVEKFRRKRVTVKPTAMMGDIIPPDDYVPGVDMIGPKTKEEMDEEKQYVKFSKTVVCLGNPES